MIIIKPDWVCHGGNRADSRNKKPCIYSIHVHPDGQRIATGSIDGTVKIWNTRPIYDEAAELDPNCHKLLSTMTNHNGAVLCVRWSNKDGRYLASSSDNDNVIMIWERDTGHESDVQDLSWSSDNRYLASCGVDGLIMIWDGNTFELVKKVDQHTGFVKGITWDPAGKFLASQSDDKRVKIWRTSDWQLETEIVGPFINAPGTTLFRLNGIQCIAAIINRDDWNADISLVGHTMPVEVTAFNPKMFYMRDDEDENIAEEASPASICALGSQDRSVSIWVTKFSRPLCVAADLFDNNIYDANWTPDGRTLFACSQDGTVACIMLDTELEDVVPDDEINSELEKYGFGRVGNHFPETPMQLELEEEGKDKPNKTPSKRIEKLMTGGEASFPGFQEDTDMTDAVIPQGNKTEASNIDIPASIITAQQKVTYKNGKKRIQPVMVSSASTRPAVATNNLSNGTVNSQPKIHVSGQLIVCLICSIYPEIR
ncbi:WD40-repeat-containing domain protein [Mycotypha africana]|uniref:WD40-repeat-containing domain protein n=1 Tax=Mycotypha africana TaxID=64632 RepID=UPI0022FFF098|nr:WD40-repeat-containing domain protein [Mycotypha africana]KAI8975694.1 WD40-repeat-containing domain protein [Mycotypha africana]